MSRTTAALMAGLLLAGSLPALAHTVDPALYHRHLRHGAVVDPRFPPPPDYGPEAAPGSYPAIGYGRDPRPNGGFSVNPYGYGNYTMGADGGFGGYPPGSAGAAELREQQNRKCRVVPEQC